MDDSLKNMIEDIIQGRDEDAQTHFHSFVQGKIQKVFGNDEELDEEALGDRDKKVKSTVDKIVNKNKGKDSSKNGLTNVSADKTRDLDFSGDIDKQKDLK